MFEILFCDTTSFFSVGNVLLWEGFLMVTGTIMHSTNGDSNDSNGVSVSVCSAISSKISSAILGLLLKCQIMHQLKWIGISFFFIILLFSATHFLPTLSHSLPLSRYIILTLILIVLVHFKFEQVSGQHTNNNDAKGNRKD